MDGAGGDAVKHRWKIIRNTGIGKICKKLQKIPESVKFTKNRLDAYAEEGWTALAGWNLAVLQSRTAKNIKTKLHERAWELARNQESANQEPEIVANRELAEANWAETHFRPFLSALHDTVLQQIPFL